jgi:hypothetical protein
LNSKVETRTARIREVLFAEMKKERPHGGMQREETSSSPKLGQKSGFIAFLLPVEEYVSVLRRFWSKQVFLGRGVHFSLANSHLWGTPGLPTVRPS